MMAFFGGQGRQHMLLQALAAVLVLSTFASASVGDRLPEFRECLQVCEHENCGPDGTPLHTTIPLHRRLLLWTCSAECDYTCQHIITARRLAEDPPQPIVQFHGKWPFTRILGIQEPFSVICSLGNFLAHWHGLHERVRRYIPANYSLRPWYEWLAYIGMASWAASTVFHTRDFLFTEQVDYFAAGASVLYGLYYTTVRLARLDRPTPRRRSALRAWTVVCLAMYAGHVAYLKLWRWDYTYNMAANVAVGIVQNLAWTWFSFDKYRRSRRAWAVWPGLVVAWVLVAMSLELLDFPPLWGAVDAHSLWHLGTIAPTVLWYNFLVKDAQDDIASEARVKE